MKILLIGSSGLFGNSIIRAANDRGVEVTKVSRGNEDSSVHYCDLSDLNSISASLLSIEGIDYADVAVINSGILGPVGLGGEIDLGAALNAININALSNIPVFQALYRRGIRKYIVISSGAANKDYAGWFAYCQSKALQKSIWESFCHDYSDVSVKLIAPGVLNSDMHNFTNLVSKEKYPELEKFYEIKDSNGYQDPEESASKIFNLVSKEDFFTPGSEFIDLRDL